MPTLYNSTTHEKERLLREKIIENKFHEKTYKVHITHRFIFINVFTHIHCNISNGL